MDRARVTGGDVGVRVAGSGPFLVTGYEAALAADWRVETTRDLMADSVLLRDRATVGDVGAGNITNQFGVYVQQYALPAMPAFPDVAPVTPGTAPFTVASGQTRTMSAGAYGAGTVNGTLNLTGGAIQIASLTIGNDAKVQAVAPSQLRIAGRVSTGDRARLQAIGGTLTAKDLRVEDQRPRLDGTGTADAAVPASVGSKTVTLNAAGFVTALGDTTFSYSPRGFLKQVTPPAPALPTFVEADASLRRIIRQEGASPAPSGLDFYVYEGHDIVAVVGPGAALRESYLFDGIDHPLRIKRGSTTAYYELDLAGNVRGLRLSGGSSLGDYHRSGAQVSDSRGATCESTRRGLRIPTPRLVRSCP